MECESAIHKHTESDIGVGKRVLGEDGDAAGGLGGGERRNERRAGTLLKRSRMKAVVPNGAP